MSTLLDRVDALLEEDRPSRVRLRIPQKEGKMLALLEAAPASIPASIRTAWWFWKRKRPASLLRRMREWVVE